MIMASFYSFKLAPLCSFSLGHLWCFKLAPFYSLCLASLCNLLSNENNILRITSALHDESYYKILPHYFCFFCLVLDVDVWLCFLFLAASLLIWACFFFPLSGFFLQLLELWPVVPHNLQVILIPTFPSLVDFRILSTPWSLFLYVFGLLGVLT